MDSPDCFALFEVPRQPWPDLEDLKQRFLQLCRERHPDRSSGTTIATGGSTELEFAGLTAAYNLLRDPRERLTHLLALERGRQPADVQRIPPGTTDLFAAVGTACREADAFLADTDPGTSPMLRVRQFERALEWTDRLQALQETVCARWNQVAAALQAMNGAWEKAPPPGSPGRLEALPLQELEQLRQIGSYLLRWQDQLGERIARLSLL